MGFFCCRFFAVLCCTLFLVVSSGVLQGCRTVPARAESSPPTPAGYPLGGGDKAVVRSLPEYKKATALFAKGDKTGAKLALEALLKTPNLSPTDTAFLKTQIGLCDASPLRGQLMTLVPEEDD